MLGCHYATLLYRERKGDIKPIRVIAGRKYYHRLDVIRLMQQRPVNPKPHYTKRASKQTKPKQTLWTKIKSFLSAFVAK